VVGYRGERPALPRGSLAVSLHRTRPGWTYHSLLRAVRSVSATPPDVVLSASLDVPFLGLPTVATVRDLVGNGWRPLTLRERFYRARARRFGAVVVPSVASRDALKAAGLETWRMHVVPEHVDEATVVSLPSGPVLRLVHAGRIHPGKAQHLSIDAVSRLPPAAKSRVHLDIVGAPTDRVYVDQLRIAARGQPIALHTEVESLRPFIDGAHLVLYPTSLSEGFADVALMAMAQGRPVIWSDHPGVRATTGGVGVAIRPDDVGSLRDAILRHIDDRPGLLAMGTASHEVARRHHWHHIASRWETVLELATR
jgi:glycosyltransferase involved in cell wall biosynthesis